MAKEYFCAYHSYLETMEQLSDAECGRLFRACLTYSKLGATQELFGNERFVFSGLKSQIDRDNEAYTKKCAAQAKNAGMRWHATVCDGMVGTAKRANHAKEKAKEKEKTKEKT